MADYIPSFVPPDTQPSVDAGRETDEADKHCSRCARTMRLREVRDYGLPSDTTRRVSRILRLECDCGHAEVLTRRLLA